MWPTETDLKLDEFNALELPGQQLQAANALTPLDHILNLDINAPPGCMRLTGIAATIGQSTSDTALIEKLIGNGMNIAVLNTAFGSVEDHVKTIEMSREAARNYGSRMGRYYPLAIAFRLSGRKIRTGRISQMYGDSVELKTGETVRLTTDEIYRDKCSMLTIYVDYIDFAEHMSRNDIVLIDNEIINLKVEMISSNTLTCKVLRGGTLHSYRDVFVPNKNMSVPNISEKDKQFIEIGIHYQIDMMILSFVTSALSVEELKNALGEKGRKIAIISNVCTLEGFKNYDEILEASDAIMITRQELGTDISPKKLVIAQKNMIARANKANVPIMVCTHILSTMRYNEVALRSEQLDIANLVLDGVDVLVLSSETAIGEFPIKSVSTLNMACKESEACVWTKQIFNDMIDQIDIPCDHVTGTAMSAVMAANRSIAAAIVVITATGQFARIVAKFKPRCPIIAVTRYPYVARKMHLWKGVLPLYYDRNPHNDWLVDTDNRVAFSTEWGVERGFIRIGDPVVVVCGWRHGSGFTNTMRIMYVQHKTV